MRKMIIACNVSFADPIISAKTVYATFIKSKVSLSIQRNFTSGAKQWTTLYRVRLEEEGLTFILTDLIDLTLEIVI